MSEEEIAPDSEIPESTDLSPVEEAPAAEVQEEVATSKKDEPITQERLNEVWYQKKAAEREVATLRAELNQAKLQTPEVQEKQIAQGAPTLEDFDYDQDKFTEAFITHQVEEKLKVHEEKRTQEIQQEQMKVKAGSFQAKAASYAEKNPDYVEAYSNPAGVQYKPHVYKAVLEEGPQMDHYLLKNPMVAEKLNNSDPVLAAVEIGKLSATLKPQKKIVSNAPPAIEPVQGSGAIAQDPRYDPNITPEEYYKYSMEKKGG